MRDAGDAVGAEALIHEGFAVGAEVIDHPGLRKELGDALLGQPAGAEMQVQKIFVREEHKGCGPEAKIEIRPHAYPLVKEAASGVKTANGGKGAHPQ